jgi:hypothetical protein
MTIIMVLIHISPGFRCVYGAYYSVPLDFFKKEREEAIMNIRAGYKQPPLLVLEGPYVKAGNEA